MTRSSSMRAALLTTLGCATLGGCVAGMPRRVASGRTSLDSCAIAPQHAVNHIQEPLLATAALHFGDNEPLKTWAFQPGARGVAGHVTAPVPAPAFEWDFEEGRNFDADGWTVRDGDRLALPSACGRIDADRLPGGDALTKEIGGDYWRRSYWPGQSGECLVDTTDRRVTFVSPAITLGPGTRHISFLVGGGGLGGRVRLERDGCRGDIFREAGPGGVGMVRVDHEVPDSEFGRTARLVVEGFGGHGVLVDDVVGSADAVDWKQPEAPLWGFVDLHNHVFNHLTSGGQMFAGRVTAHPLSGDIQAGLRAKDGMRHALEDCRTSHGAFPDGGDFSTGPEDGHLRDGYPTFDGWPKATSLVHEQVYVDWLKRAWHGGLRIVQVDVGNTDFAAKVYADGNFWLGHRHPFPHTNDADAIDRTLDAVREFVDGEGRGWTEVATSSADARRIVAEGRLALVLGIEVDSIGNSYASCPSQHGHLFYVGRPTCCPMPADGAGMHARIQQLLDRLYLRGVSHIIPVHVIRNAFGNPAVYGRAFDIQSTWANGCELPLGNGWDRGVRFQLGADLVQGSGFKTWLLETFGDTPKSFDPARLDGGIPANGQYSHIALGGLTAAGTELLTQMMHLGMLIDIQHMGERTADAALTLAEQKDYPVMTSHTEMRELAFGTRAPVAWEPNSESTIEQYDTAQIERVAGEQLRSREQLDRIRRLGGMVGVHLHTNNIAGRWGPEGTAFCDDSAVTWGSSYRYAVDMLGGRGVAIGSDANGLAGFPEPRFGPSACEGANQDDYRRTRMPAMAAAQRNGVAYDVRPGKMGVLDAGVGRFSKSGTGYAYTDGEREIWEALAEAEVAADQPTRDDAFRFLDAYDQRAFWRWPETGDRIRRRAKGFWVAEHGLPVGMLDGCKDVCNDDDSCAHPCVGPDAIEMDAYYAYPPHVAGEDQNVRKLEPVVDAWLRMQGNNPPIHKYVVRDTDEKGHFIQRDFDVNLEGLAHYGLLPDWLQDNRNIGLDEQHMAPLFMGAEDYVEMWQRAEQRAAAMGGPPAEVAGKPRGP